MISNEAIDAHLKQAERDISSALEGIPLRFDGTNNNQFLDLSDPAGDTIGLGRSEKPDGIIGYQVQKSFQPDVDGYVKTWGFSFGDVEPQLLYTRTHSSRLTRSMTHEDDARRILELDETQVMVMNGFIKAFVIARRQQRSNY